ncbi:helix-turn-helix transcriptional regulator [Actinacidiphila bryophytorum]|uniref:DNA binding domain-containing protein, excisionase family n=1 Tax=Actinacidiphila bryophytorum TaxID=1436133 RepID=A0A9W4GYF2_9ACTN|nr:helix-turn-helix domain-containing protein [Actinacidiphila bryophytorum]MBM9438898.1 helix-turn-helix domain-containing protein [Actinacidiphila bryophytorum]MBN6544692.1 helix-turn-helix domain-containing protein [Actinacidiphila bryophytorum]CAG7615908.1 DNA binding domain-containing protein, excisionase family [Actinacidiphila bryophytorum]
MSTGQKTANERRPLATPAELSEYLGVPVATLYQWRHRGLGPKAHKVGRHLRCRWAEVEAWVDQQAVGLVA